MLSGNGSGSFETVHTGHHDIHEDDAGLLGFQVFDTVYMMIGKASPAFEATQTVVALFYRTAFDYGYKGYAAAISILIFAAIMIVTVIQMIGQKKWVNYD